LKAHLERLFTSETEPVTLLFEQKVEGKSLYDLRHTTCRSLKFGGKSQIALSSGHA
jgi:hypothetical protein